MREKKINDIEYGIIYHLQMDMKIAKNPHHYWVLGYYSLAGAEGLEPSARGFGDHCSTN